MKKNLLYIGNKLSKKGSTVTSIETLGSFLKSEGYIVTTASSKKYKVPRLLDMLWHVIKITDKNTVVLIDTYSTQNFYYAVWVAWVCRLKNMPYIPILRGGNLPKRLEDNPKQCKRLFNKARVNVAPSLYLMDSFKQRGFKNLIHIPNTIELDRYSFRKRKVIAPRLLWVRSFVEIYHPKLAIEVIEQLRNLYPNSTLTMVGPPKDKTFGECKSYAQRHHLPVTFTGMLSKKEWLDLSAEHDIFINTTNFDNTPVSVIEAMALGLPVISTNVGGIPYLITHKQHGVLVPPREVKPFVQEIISLLNDSNKVEKISIQARQKVEMFDWDTVKHQWNELLNSQ
jgi:L-malate glycosyltransferase